MAVGHRLKRSSLSLGFPTTAAPLSDGTVARLTSTLLEREVLASDSTRAPLRLNFPAALASRWMPGLFPEKVE